MSILRTTILLVLTALIVLTLGTCHALSLSVSKVDKTLRITVLGSPSQKVSLSVDLVLDYPPQHTIKISLSNVKIPTRNNFISISFTNVKEACIYVSFGVARVGKCLTSSSGSITISHGNIPPGTYTLELLIVPLSSTHDVTITVHIEAEMALSTTGKLNLQYYIDSLRIRRIEVSCDGITKTLVFNLKTSTSTTGTTGIPTTGGVTVGKISSEKIEKNITKTSSKIVKTYTKVTQKTVTKTTQVAHHRKTITQGRIMKIQKIENVVLEYNPLTKVEFRGKIVGTLTELKIKVKKVSAHNVSKSALYRLHIQHLRLLSPIYNITIGNYTHVLFSRPITICLPFYAENVNKSNVRVGYWNSTVRRWILLKTIVEIRNSTFYACTNVTHLTLFAVFVIQHVVNINARPYLVQIIPEGQQVTYLICANTNVNTSRIKIYVNSTSVVIKNGTCALVTFSRVGTYVIRACADSICNRTVLRVINYARLCNFSSSIVRISSGHVRLVLKFVCSRINVRIRAVVEVLFDNGSKLRLLLSENRSLSVGLSNNVRKVLVRFAGVTYALNVSRVPTSAGNTYMLLSYVIAAVIACVAVITVAVYYIRRRVSRRVS